MKRNNGESLVSILLQKTELDLGDCILHSASAGALFTLCTPDLHTRKEEHVRSVSYTDEIE